MYLFKRIFQVNDSVINCQASYAANETPASIRHMA